MNSSIDIVNILIKAGPDINHQSRSNKTALMLGNFFLHFFFFNSFFSFNNFEFLNSINFFIKTCVKNILLRKDMQNLQVKLIN